MGVGAVGCDIECDNVDGTSMFCSGAGLDGFYARPLWKGAFGRLSGTGRPAAGEGGARAASDAHQVVGEEVRWSCLSRARVLNRELCLRLEDDVDGTGKAGVGRYPDSDRIGGVHRYPWVRAPVRIGNRFRYSMFGENMRREPAARAWIFVFRKNVCHRGAATAQMRDRTNDIDGGRINRAGEGDRLDVDWSTPHRVVRSAV